MGLRSAMGRPVAYATVTRLLIAIYVPMFRVTTRELPLRSSARYLYRAWVIGRDQRWGSARAARPLFAPMSCGGPCGASGRLCCARARRGGVG